MTEHARLARELQVPNAIVALNGQMVRLAPGTPAIVDETPSGRLHLDGDVLVHEEDGFARSRRALSYAGFIGITLVLDRKGRVAADPVLHIEGIPDAVIEPVNEAIANALNGKRGDELKEQVRIAARRAARDVWGKKPVVRVETVEI
jgi:ribonuclease J